MARSGFATARHVPFAQREQTLFSRLKYHAAFSRPMYHVFFGSLPTVFIHPKVSSARFRIFPDSTSRQGNFRSL